jgi:hypothetical protein
MKKKGSGPTYIVSRAVEEPIEATFELGEDISKHSAKLRRPVGLGIIGNFFTLLLVLPSLYFLILLIADIRYGRVELTLMRLFGISVFAIIFIILIAVVATSLIYLIQINKFYVHLMQRYSMINDLRNRSTENAPKVKSGLTKTTGKHVKNPILATLDLVEESMHELPQIVKLLRFCIYFISIIFGFFFIIILTKLAVGFEPFLNVTYYDLIFLTSSIVIFIPTLIFLFEAENLFMYLQARHEIIDSIRFESQINIPTGKTQVDRLAKYLSDNDPFIRSSIRAGIGEFQKNITLKTSSGADNNFDLYFSDDNKLRQRSLRLGIPSGKFSVFVKIFKNEITKKDLQELRDVVVDICNRQQSFPLRIIALQWNISELVDDVYDYVLENPIKIKRAITHLQIVAEDAELYSFIPMISYGQEVK